MNSNSTSISRAGDQLRLPLSNIYRARGQARFWEEKMRCNDIINMHHEIPDDGARGRGVSYLETARDKERFDRRESLSRLIEGKGGVFICWDGWRRCAGKGMDGSIYLEAGGWGRTQGRFCSQWYRDLDGWTLARKTGVHLIPGEVCVGFRQCDGYTGNCIEGQISVCKCNQYECIYVQEMFVWILNKMPPAVLISFTI